MIYLHDSDGTYYIAYGNFAVKNDMPYYAYHIPNTAQNYAKNLGVSLQELDMEIFQDSRTTIPWHKIDKVSFDNWSTYQTVFAATSLGFTVPPDDWTYSMQIALLVSPLRYGTVHTSSEVWGKTSVSLTTNGNYTPAPVKLTYRGAKYYFPLDVDLKAHTGDALTYTRSGSITYNGVSYDANVPIFDEGLHIGENSIAKIDLPSFSVGSLMLKLLYNKKESLTYLSDYDIGSFEQDTNANGVCDNWTESQSANITATWTRDATHIEGSYSQKVVASLASSSANYEYARVNSDYLSAEANTNYYLNLQGNITANTNFFVYAIVYSYDSSYSLISQTTAVPWGTSVTTTGFEFKSIAFTTPANTAYIAISLRVQIAAGDTGSITMYWDDVKVFKANRIISSDNFGLELDWANQNLKLTSGANTLSTSFAGVIDDFLYNSKYLFCGIEWDASNTYLAVGEWDDITETFLNPTTNSGTFSITFGGTTYIGSDGANYFWHGSIQDLVLYDYEVPNWTTAEWHLTTEPLQWNDLYIANVTSGMITYQDGKLIDEDGNDITGLVSGTPLVEGDIEMTAGLSGLWSVEADDTYLP